MRTALAVLVLAGGLSGPLDEQPITFYGIGPVRVGATVRSASLAAGAPLSGGASASDACRYVHLKTAPSMLFMVEKGRIVRVETRDRRFRTASGARVGDSEATVRRIYGRRLEVTGHKYDQHGHYLIVRSTDRRYAMVMETDGKKVIFIRSGALPAAEYVEGCS
jgi:hypothetical protein